MIISTLYCVLFCIFALTFIYIILLKLEKALEILKNGGVILYPTDTIWGIGCDATNVEAINKIFEIKKREKNKSMIILVENERRLQDLVDVPEMAWQIIDLSPLKLAEVETKGLLSLEINFLQKSSFTSLMPILPSSAKISLGRFLGFS